jgi:hypothetical protein
LGEHVLRGIALPCTVFTMPDAYAQALSRIAGRVERGLSVDANQAYADILIGGSMSSGSGHTYGLRPTRA